MTPTLPYDLVMLDLECTSNTPPRITEVGAVLIPKELSLFRKPYRTFQTLVNPEEPINPVKGAEDVFVISEEMVKDAPTWGPAVKNFSEWCEDVSPKRGYIFTAWGTHFDMCVIRAECNRIKLKFPFPGKCLDAKTMVVMHLWNQGDLVPSIDAEKALAKLGMELSEGQRHRALPDAINQARALVAALGRDLNR